MARDRSKDNKYFNCSQDHETEYVASLYPATQRESVRNYLRTSCSNGTIHYSTHMDVYKLIERDRGLPIPG